MSIDVSVVLPTFNEVGNICQLIDKIQSQIPSQLNYEILVMDDNSPDGTFDAVSSAYDNDNRVRPILRTCNRGFAKSIYDGIINAEGHYVIVMDTDLTHDPSEIPRLLHVASVFDIVSASRFCSGGRMSSKFHYISSFAYNLVLRVILGTQVQDNLGGYFIAKKTDIMSLDHESIFYGYGEYYFRLLYAMAKSGRSIVEIPSKYLDRSAGKSKSNWLKMFITYGVSAIEFKFRGA